MVRAVLNWIFGSLLVCAGGVAQSQELAAPPAAITPPLLQYAPSPEELRSSIDNSIQTQATGVTAAARLLRGASPEMPREAILANITGEVDVEFLVDESGCVTKLHVIRSSHALLTQAVVAAIQKWEFSPMIENEVPVPFIAHQVFEFKITER